ncbi:predicted protein [Botrytis cinerea T4]|uniref:Uncharacterized protein n=1 Tax=Botryotinia fuckeliana (strain T4) TaxID=999810 RepID=G2YUA1_BOTF4|nr:predicted protein [Botrytis cinerea T4]
MPSDYYPGVCKDRLTVFISYAGLFQLESHLQFFFWPQHIFLSISSTDYAGNGNIKKKSTGEEKGIRKDVSVGNSGAERFHGD